MIVMKFSNSLLLLLALLMSACMPPQPGQPTVPTDNDQMDLANSWWLLESFGQSGAETLVANEFSITLAFEGNGQAGGHSGCNSYVDSYSVQGSVLRFEEISSTLIACEDQSITEQEQKYLDALRTVGRFTADDESLTIWYEGDSSVLKFTRAPASTLDPSPTTSLGSTAAAVPGKDVGARIEFPGGQSSAEVFAELAAGATDSYLVRGQQGQILSVEIISPNNDVLLSVIVEDGTPLKRYQNGPPSWTGTLPETQDYVLQAVSVGETAAYTLRVQIERIPPQARERVEFGSGSTSATRSGTLPPGGVKEYVLLAAAGQRLHIQTVGYTAPVHFTLRSPDDQSWSGEPGASDVYIFTVEVFLPEAGDYVVTLTVPLEEDATRYDAAFTIDASTQSSTPPERVELESGAVSAKRSGLLPSGSGLKEYVLTGHTGQTMTITVTSDDAPLSLMITTPSGVQRIPASFPARAPTRSVTASPCPKRAIIS
jgi:heat shock protein HslJ